MLWCCALSTACGHVLFWSDHPSFTSLVLVSRLFNVLYASRCALLLVYSLFPLTNTQEHWVLLLLIMYNKSALGGINWTDSPLVCVTISYCVSLCMLVSMKRNAGLLEFRWLLKFTATSAEDIRQCSVFCIRSWGIILEGHGIPSPGFNRVQTWIFRSWSTRNRHWIRSIIHSE